MKLHDFIVVGSGCTGAMAAQTLAEGGAQVLILDGGKKDEQYENRVPEKNFIDLRRHDDDQQAYFLGDRFESIPDSTVGTGAQLTPPRQYLIDRVNEYLPVSSETFFPMESLARGGLGGGWGLGCCVFSEQELQKAGLPVQEMQQAYQTIADRIGISGAADDAQPYTFAHLGNIQTATPADPTAHLFLQRYARKKETLNKKGFYLGRPALALLTQNKNDRRATGLRDMDFYSDTEKAAYRPQFTIDQLQRLPNVQYEGGVLVTHFEEKDDHVIVHGLRLGDNEALQWSCRKLVLAPGVLGTARIVLRSLPGKESLPLLCNPYSYIPFLVPKRVGKNMPEQLSGFAQLSLFHDPNHTHDDVAMASIYTYRSLLLFRLLREVPLNFRDARLLMQWMLSGIVILGLHHPEASGGEKKLQLITDPHSPTHDRLEATYIPAATETQRVHEREHAYARALRSLGAWKLKRVDPGFGSSIHYAGVLPFSTAEDGRTLHADGRIGGTQHIFVADGSGFRYLPAKGLTLSLMANAHTVAKGLL